MVRYIPDLCFDSVTFISTLTKLFLLRDIVDTEPFPDGNLLKMLLGAVHPWFDDDNDDDDDVNDDEPD